MAGKHSIGSRIGLALLFLFGLPFALGGLAIDVGVLRMGYDDVRMMRWREVPCTILATDLKLLGHGDSSSYHLTAQYRYEVEGQQHIGHNVTVDDSDDANGSYQKRLRAELEQARTSGKPFRCYVNPGSPDESILYPGARWFMAALQVVAALMFSGVGFGLLGVVVNSWLSKPPRAVSESSASIPWKQRADWASGEIRHSDRKTGTVLIGVGLAVLLISFRSLLASGLALLFQDGVLPVLGLIPSAVGLWLVIYGRRRRRRWRWYGDSVLQLAAVPGVIGGPLAGVVRVERRVESPAGFVIRLKCSETIHSTSSSDDGPNSTMRLVWEQERTILHDMRSVDSEGIAIPVYFGIPYGVPESDEKSNDRVDWTLSIRSASPEADYKAEFTVPVFRTSQSNPHYRPDESLIAAYEAPVDATAPLRKAGVRTEPLENGGVMFVFPPGRNLGLTFFVALLQSIIVAAIVGLCYFKWTVAWPYVAAFFGVSLLYSIVDMFGYSSEVEATPGGLAVRAGIFNFGGRRDISAADLDKIVVEGAGSSGSPTGFDLFAVLRSGKRLRLAKRIWPRDAADLVVQQIKRILR